MTESEAIKELHKIRPAGAIIPQKRAEALDVAIKALRKQIPQKILYEDIGYDCRNDVNVYACICPSCRCKIIEFTDDDISTKYDSCDGNVEKMFHSSMQHHAYIGLNNYCNRCGQKLDWSDKNETD